MKLFNTSIEVIILQSPSIYYEYRPPFTITYVYIMTSVNSTLYTLVATAASERFNLVRHESTVVESRSTLGLHLMTIDSGLKLFKWIC